MKLHAFKFGLACSISATVLWVIYGVFVAAMPAMMMSMSATWCICSCRIWGGT